MSDKIDKAMEIAHRINEYMEPHLCDWGPRLDIMADMIREAIEEVEKTEWHIVAAKELARNAALEAARNKACKKLEQAMKCITPPSSMCSDALDNIKVAWMMLDETRDEGLRATMESFTDAVGESPYLIEDTTLSKCDKCGMKPVDGFGEGDMCHCGGRFRKEPTDKMDCQTCHDVVACGGWPETRVRCKDYAIKDVFGD